MMEKKEMAKILCTVVDDAEEPIDVRVNFNGTRKHLLLAFSAITKGLLEGGISPRLLSRAFKEKDVLHGKTDKDGGAE